jgi:Glycine-zipper domain
MKLMTLTLAVVTGLTLAGCGNTTASRSLSGGAIGASGGAILGAIGGNAGLGAAVGAGAGLLGGYLYDQHEKGNIDY